MSYISYKRAATYDRVPGDGLFQVDDTEYTDRVSSVSYEYSVRIQPHTVGSMDHHINKILQSICGNRSVATGKKK